MRSSHGPPVPLLKATNSSVYMPLLLDAAGLLRSSARKAKHAHQENAVSPLARPFVSVRGPCPSPLPAFSRLQVRTTSRISLLSASLRDVGEPMRRYCLPGPSQAGDSPMPGEARRHLQTATSCPGPHHHSSSLALRARRHPLSPAAQPARARDCGLARSRHALRRLHLVRATAVVLMILATMLGCLQRLPTDGQRPTSARFDFARSMLSFFLRTFLSARAMGALSGRSCVLQGWASPQRSVTQCTPRNFAKGTATSHIPNSRRCN